MALEPGPAGAADTLVELEPVGCVAAAVNPILARSRCISWVGEAATVRGGSTGGAEGPSGVTVVRVIVAAATTSEGGVMALVLVLVLALSRTA